MALDIADIVRVTASIRPRGTLRRELGNLLFLTTDDTLDAGGANKVRTYSRFQEVADDFASDAEPYLAARTWFSQSPFPRNFIVGRWVNANVNSSITGGAPADLATLLAVSNGRFRFNENDVATDIDLTSAATFNGIAGAIQTVLRAAPFSLTSATVTYQASPSRFVVDLGNQDEFDGVFSEHSQDTGTDLSALLSLDAASGAVFHQGANQESVTEALEAVFNLNSDAYFIALEKQFNGTSAMRAVSAWAGTQELMFAAESNESDALTTAESATELAQISALESPRTWATWSETADYKAVSIAARLSSVEFSAPGSLITAKFKSLPGTLPDRLTTTQKRELDRKRVNHYSPFGTDNIYAEGFTLSPSVWIDVQYWIDWIVNAVRTDVYNLLRSSPKVPQTPAGLATIKEVVERVCQQGVTNGGIAPGTVSPGMAADIRQATGNTEFDGMLSTGYLVFVTPIASQSQTEREARESPPFRVWLKGAGAIHFASIDLTFEN